MIVEHDGQSDATALVADLSDAFGSEPVETQYAGGIESAPGTYFAWGGFQLLVQDFDATPGWSNLSYTVTSATVGDVAVTAGDSLRVGDVVASPVACPGDTGGFTLDSDGISARNHCVESVDLGDSPDGLGPMIDSVAARVDAAGTVHGFYAPHKNYGV